MSATIHHLPVNVPITAKPSERQLTSEGLEAAAMQVLAMIREAKTVPEAYTYFRALRSIEGILLALTTAAMQRCEELEKEGA